MKKSIWKFPLNVEAEQVIVVPKGAKFLSLQTQKGAPCVWAEVDTETEERESWYLEAFGTGHPLSDDAREFLGTYLVRSDELVLHVFRTRISNECLMENETKESCWEYVSQKVTNKRYVEDYFHTPMAVFGEMTAETFAKEIGAQGWNEVMAVLRRILG
jgi:hypothetical protein